MTLRSRTVMRRGRRRCDASCHFASTPRSSCTCICGGMLHGTGDEAREIHRQRILGRDPQTELEEVQP